MLTDQRRWSRGRFGSGLIQMTAIECCVLILAALGWNALGFGVLLLADGTTNLWTVGLVLSGGVTGLVATGWLVIVYQVREIVGATV